MSIVWPEDRSLDTASTSMGTFDSYADVVRSSSLRRSSSGKKQLLENSLQVADDVESGEPHHTIGGRRVSTWERDDVVPTNQIIFFISRTNNSNKCEIGRRCEMPVPVHPSKKFVKTQ
ncbi:hypothetical protein J6590_073836 [Homalodisca vitripennis]|nr:hypothetical protein J6590_073836 [Homalodisca vitripennis]